VLGACPVCVRDRLNYEKISGKTADIAWLIGLPLIRPVLAKSSASQPPIKGQRLALMASCKCCRHWNQADNIRFNFAY
jgi:hypothetical protein